MKMELQELAATEVRGGPLAEEGLPCASQPGIPSQELPSRPTRQEIKQEQDEQCWEVQWKEYLKTLQDPHQGRRNLQPPWFPSEEDSKEFQVSSRGEVAEIHPLPPKESVRRTWPGLSGEGHESSPDLSVKVKEETVEEDSLESRRQDFRRFSYQETKLPGEICRQLLGLCCQWLKPDRHSVDQILDLLVLEQFLAILPEKMQRWIRAGGAESCAHAVSLAEYFLWRLPKVENTEVQVLEPFEEVIVSSPKAEWEESEAEGNQLSLEAEPVDEGEAGLLQAVEGSRQRKESIGEPQRPAQDAVSDVSPERDKGSVFQTPEVEERLENYQQTKKQCGNHPGKKLGKDFICQEGHLHLNKNSSQARTSWPKTQKGRKGLNPSSCQKKCQKGPYACSYCGKKWPCPSQLLRHESIHTGEKLHKCIKCGKSFNRRSNLTTHERTHTGEKPHQCSQCGKSFIRRTHLMKHKRIHVKENPCNCLGCSRRNSSLSITSHLNVDPRHRDSAHGQSFLQCKSPKLEETLMAGKPNQCRDCGKSFSCHSRFLRHEKSHAKERPHKCTECGKSFCTRSNLSQHRRTHTGERPYSCKHCGKSYRRKSSLVQHQQETCQKGNCLNGSPVGFVVLGNCALLCMKQPAQVGVTGPVDPQVEMISQHLSL